MKWAAAETGWGWLQNTGTLMGLYTSALGAHLTWTLPFGLLIMFAVFNRFVRPKRRPPAISAPRPADPAPRGGADLGPSLVGVALFGFTLSFDELARTSQAIARRNTLPLELQGPPPTVTTRRFYALGTLTTGMSLAVIATALGASLYLQRRKARAGLRLG